MVILLKDGPLGSPAFRHLEVAVGPALKTLGASPTETEEIKELIQKSKDEVYTAEKTYLKLGLVAPDRIEIDASGVREPVSAIIGRLKDGIYSSLRPEAAEIIISAIKWERYYRMDEKDLVTSLEMIRKPSGELTAWARTSSAGTGGGVVKNKFPDDGTPLPADEIFGERWRPYLKGLTIVHKDEK